MTKDQIGLLVLLVGLLGTVLTAGIRIGTLTERIESQSKQIDALTEEVKAINAGLIAWTVSHDDRTARRTQ